MKCPSCGYENSEDAQYCDLCQTSFVKAQPKAPGLTAPPPEAGVPARLPREARELSWFHRHLNWTWVLAQVAVFLISVVFVVIFASMIMNPSDSGRSEGALFLNMLLFRNMLIVLEVVVTLGVGAWALKRKSRSLAWLLLLFVPIGWIFFLLLENRSNIPDISSMLVSAKPRLEPRSQSW